MNSQNFYDADRAGSINETILLKKKVLLDKPVLIGCGEFNDQKSRLYQFCHD
jgi:hypothetical protein